MPILRFLDRLRLKNKNFTLLSNNCIGVLVYHKFKLKYLSPTINLQISPTDFIKFCTNLDHYLACELQEVKDCDDTWFRSIGGGKIDFPVGRIDDILIYFQHDKIFSKAKEDWIRRTKRINKNNLFVVLLDVLPSDETIDAFNNLPYENRLYLYTKSHFDKPNCFKIKGLEQSVRTWYQDMPGRIFKKKFFEQFDFVKWLNQKSDC